MIEDSEKSNWVDSFHIIAACSQICLPEQSLDHKDLIFCQRQDPVKQPTDESFEKFQLNGEN